LNQVNEMEPTGKDHPLDSRAWSKFRHEMAVICA
jgi:hypothetical protein